MRPRFVFYAEAHIGGSSGIGLGAKTQQQHAADSGTSQVSHLEENAAAAQINLRGNGVAAA